MSDTCARHQEQQIYQGCLIPHILPTEQRDGDIDDYLAFPDRKPVANAPVYFAPQHNNLELCSAERSTRTELHTSVLPYRSQDLWI
jgi:hypothetical protein